MHNFFKKGLLTCAIIGSLGFVSHAPVVYAQDTAENLETVGDASGLGSEDIRIVIANIIRIGLTFLGVVALCIVLYGGFVWMTASGDVEKVERAKKILVNGGIGLVIILMSWTITTFVMTSILGATGSSGGSGSGGGGGGTGVTSGGSSSALMVTGITPQGEQTIRNIQVQAVFSRAVSSTSSERAMVITNTLTGEEVEGTLTYSGKRITFVPASACPSPNEDRFCFDENTEYSVSVSADVESTSGSAVTCTSETCTGSFTSGTLVDIEDPNANMTAPDDRDAIAADSYERAEVQATDDAGIAVADFSVDGGESFESVAASGSDIRDVVLEAIWDTAGLTVGEKYEVSVVVTDVAGNTDEDSVTVTARLATCFNGVQDDDAGETGVDCGGNSASVSYCGSCDGSSCTESSTCGGSSSCENGICSDLPVISGIYPDNGAPGTYVTITGTGFGNSEGFVYFSTTTGSTIRVPLASCGKGWTDEEIIVVIPGDVGDGPVSVMTSGGDVDYTNDEEGELVPDFDVNTTSRPFLCELTPDSGGVADVIVLSGGGFGSRMNSEVIFGDGYTAGSYMSWKDDGITATIPAVGEGKYSVSVFAAGIESNTVTLSVEEGVESDAPTITEIDPSSGGSGQYITITGIGFGERLGSVWFEHQETGERMLADTQFPDACADDIWSDTEITVIVPDADAGNYLVSVETRSGESSPVTFVITTASPTPGLCSLSPSFGEESDSITLYGDNFGSAQGSVYFSTAVSAEISAWSGDEIVVTVPASAETGTVYVVDSSASESNALTFILGSDGTVSASSNAAAYAWSFSSGEISDVPEVVVECSSTRVSAVPNDAFTDEACVNAVIYAEFTVPMNEGTLDDALLLQKCVGSGSEPCSETNAVAGSYATTSTSVTFTPGDDLDTATTYQVTLSEQAMSTDAMPLASDVTWTFTTKSDESACEVERVLVSPEKATIESEGATQEFSALPLADCAVLSADDYVWGWDADESYVSLSSSTDADDCEGGSSPCVTATALAEGVTPVTATEQASVESDSALLTINFSDPYVTQYFPNCTEACINATIGASFNIPMNEASVLSGASLYICTNELCTSLTEITTASVSCTVNEDDACTGFAFTLASTLTPGSYYRVILSGDVVSASGVPLIRTNYGEDFSWVLRTRQDASVCAVERVSISPTSAQSSEIGDQKVFTARAYGEADSCSVSGQLLDAYSYAWSWENPIADEDNDSDVTTVVAEWIDTSFSDTDPSSIVEGCTSSCTSLGSAAYAAVCGDSVLESSEGEECEDGNVTSGDGCSASCLREGSSSESGCGDGIIDTSEDCDDGNTADGDGCSEICLAEGSASVGATCGNNDIAYDAVTYAGEECDDGNAKNNDGCSSACLNEGTPTLASIGGALCGDGSIDDPYESCDDGNTTDDDGCSSQCLLEGSSRSYTSPSVCGDGTVGTGEECEDGNTDNQDGCSSQCLLEGSSASYRSPSYCGDGIVGDGELAACEVGAGGDSRIDPVQVARIADSAVFEVSSVSGEATAMISSTESSSELTAESTWTLFCAATTDTQCTDPVTQGVGTGNCCIDRPTATLVPEEGASDVCRNAALYGTFTQPMNTNSFTYKNPDGETSYRMYATLDLASVGGVCPSTHTTLAQAPSGFFMRALRTIKSWIFGRDALAGAGDCILPIEGYTQVKQEDETYRVYLNASELLAEGGEYTFIVEGDGDMSDGIASGVLSRYGVGMYGDATRSNAAVEQVFTASSEICSVDAVRVIDNDTDNAGSFSSLDESHSFSATALSYVSGVQEIAAIPGVYDWTWSSWETDEDTVLAVAQDGSGSGTATVTPAGKNGRGNVTATLTIENNVAGIETNGDVSGATPVTVLLCENPWPSIEYYPWTDSADGEDVGASEGIGWTHFSLGYCRDEGSSGTDDDLAGLTVISPNNTQDEAILKEYIFQVQGSSDAIGVRVAANADYLSPLAWYEAQGFTGSPSETTIDGFPAVKDGRTTYITAPNLDTDTNLLYANMYIISYNNSASSETQKIYGQIIDNLVFAENIDSVGYCSDGSSYTSECSSDLDCAVSSGESCADIKSKVARDTLRLTDMTDLRTAIENYGDESGYCSATTDQVCSKDADCPASETCESAVPTLPSGTFVRALASSVWGSWESILGGALDQEIGSDPLNAYALCGSDPYAEYDADTCVDETRGQYICTEGSHTYHYRAYGSQVAYIAADLEYAAVDWYYPIDEYGAGEQVSISIGGSSGYSSGFATDAFCDGTTVYGGSSACGDGVIGSGEVCEVGDLGGTSLACDSDSDGVDDGYISQICNSTCTAYEENTSATCTPASCGNGIVESPETCDDGTANGRYGYCGADCTYDSARYCGDGQLSGGELCDCGDADVYSSIPSTGRSYGVSSTGSCSEFNGGYSTSPSASCAWDCSGPASYCGDGEVTGSEQCDGSDETWSGALCNGGTNDGDICTTSSDCLGGGVCGGSGVYAACATGYTRVLPCDDTAGGSCMYTSSWSALTCTEIGSCGDGVVDPDEDCDDGNTDSTDSCTATCTYNVCGDGYLYEGEEECDEGTGNGAGCSSAYGSTCSACTTSCRQAVSSGAFCGDGVVNGAEYCDGSDIPYQYYDSTTDTVYGACSSADSGTLLTVGSITYTCRRVGLCNGGLKNGEYCTSSTIPGSGSDTSVCNEERVASTGSCVFPSCTDSCASSCPLTESTTSLLMTPNLPGSADSSSIDVYSYSSDSTSDLPNAATITIPACTVAGTLTGTIDMSDVDLPNVYVVFVTDRSGSMSTTLGSGSRMSVARDLLSESVQELYEGLGEDMYISLIGYSNKSGTGICSSSAGYSCSIDSDCTTSGATCEARLIDSLTSGFAQSSNEAVLQSRINQFSEGGNTYTVYALEDAKDMLDAIPDDGNVRKVIVLLSDGDPTDSSAGDGISAYQENINMSDDIKDSGYELYTVALTTSTSLISYMNDWSSNSGEEKNDNGIDYAYDGDTVSELEDAYQSIIDSILGVTVSLVSSDGSGAKLTSGVVTEGNNISFPWPENFTCDPTSEQEVPVQLTFLGEGTVELSNLRIEYCAP